MSLSQHKSPKVSETSAEITHLARETVSYAFSRTISGLLCTFRRFHNFIFRDASARWVYLGTGVKSGEFVLECEKIERSSQYLPRLY